MSYSYHIQKKMICFLYDLYYSTILPLIPFKLMKLEGINPNIQSVIDHYLWIDNRDRIHEILIPNLQWKLDSILEFTAGNIIWNQFHNKGKFSIWISSTNKFYLRRSCVLTSILNELKYLEILSTEDTPYLVI